MKRFELWERKPGLNGFRSLTLGNRGRGKTQVAGTSTSLDSSPEYFLNFGRDAGNGISGGSRGAHITVVGTGMLCDYKVCKRR